MPSGNTCDRPTCNGHELLDGMLQGETDTLREAGITTESSLAAPTELTVVVLNIAGNVVAEMSPGPETVADLKHALVDRCGLPFSALRLLIGDDILADGDSLLSHAPLCEILLVLMNMPQSAKELTFVKRVGAGYFGTVWKCTHNDTDGVTYAVKQMKVSLVNQHQLLPQMQREMEIHRSLATTSTLRSFYSISQTLPFSILEWNWRVSLSSPYVADTLRDFCQRARQNATCMKFAMQLHICTVCRSSIGI